MMKKSTLSLFLSCSLLVSAKQTHISGVVSIHNSEYETGKRQYVPNVQVEDFKEKAQPTTTASNGSFKLVFVNVEEKTSVNLILKKDGWQVVNINESGMISATTGQRDSVRVSMAKPERIAEYRQKLYKVGKTEAEINLAALLKTKGDSIAILQKDATKNATQIQQLQKEYAKLQAYTKIIEEQAQDLARRYAPINLDDAAPIYREAFGYFQQGNLEKAMQILRGADLIEQMDKIFKERKNIATGRKEFDKRDSLQQQRTTDLLQVLGLKADLHKARFEWDSVQICFEQRVNLDSMNVYNLWDLARFLDEQKKISLAITYYKKILALSKSKSLIASVFNNLGIVYQNNQKSVEAEGYLLKAINIRKSLVKNNPQQFERSLAEVLNNLGEFYRLDNQMSKSEKYYLESFSIYEKLSVKNSKEYEHEMATVAMNLGILYKTFKRSADAEKYYLKCFDIYKRSARDNPEKFESDLARIEMNLGEFYRENQGYDKSEQVVEYLSASLAIYERLVGLNVYRFESDLATVLLDLGIYYFDVKKDMPKAKSYYLRSFNIFERLSKGDPIQYEYPLAKTCMNLGVFYKSNKDSLNAEKYYSMAYNIYQRLVKIIPYQIEPDLAQTVRNMGNFYTDLGKTFEAEKYYLEAFSIYKRLAKNDSKNFNFYLARITMDIGTFYSINDNNIEAEKYFVHAKDIFEKLVRTDAQLYKPNLVVCSGNLAWVMVLNKKFKAAKNSAHFALKLDSTQIWIKNNLAHALLCKNKDAKAKRVYINIKNQKDETGRSYRDIINEDFDALEKAGLSKTQLNKARKWIKD